MPQMDWKNPANISRLRDLVDRGLTASQINPHFGVTRNAIIGAMRRLGIESRSGQTGANNLSRRNLPRSDFWTPERTARLTEMWATPATAYAIARELGTTEAAVKRKRERMGLPVKGRIWPNREDCELRAPRVAKPKPAPRPDRGYNVPRPSAPRMAPTPIVVVPFTEGPNTVAVGYGQCRWPGELTPMYGEAMTFCGAACCRNEHGDLRVYCEDHAAIAYRPKAPKKLKLNPQWLR